MSFLFSFWLIGGTVRIFANKATYVQRHRAYIICNAYEFFYRSDFQIHDPTFSRFPHRACDFATFWLVDSRVCHLNFQFCNFSNFNLPTSPFSFTNFRFSSFNFQRCVFQTCNIQFFKFPSQQKFSLQANNHRQVVRYFSIEKFVTVLFHDRENIGKGQVLLIFTNWQYFYSNDQRIHEGNNCISVNFNTVSRGQQWVISGLNERNAWSSLLRIAWLPLFFLF